MHQCRRLKAAPELFPSTSVKDEFLGSVARLSQDMASLQEGEVEMEKLEKDASSQIAERNYPFTDEASAKYGIRFYDVPARIPRFLPDKVDGKMPWNNWMDNSARPLRGWVAIQQKIPRAGEKIFRQITLMYDALEAEFALVSYFTLRST
jgi:hypothetical protein